MSGSASVPPLDQIIQLSSVAAFLVFVFSFVCLFPRAQNSALRFITVNEKHEVYWGN